MGTGNKITVNKVREMIKQSEEGIDFKDFYARNGKDFEKAFREAAINHIQTNKKDSDMLLNYVLYAAFAPEAVRESNEILDMYLGSYSIINNIIYDVTKNAFTPAAYKLVKETFKKDFIENK